MLEISGITKDYVLKDQTVQALKGVDIRFRRSEFVSILGPSGCGKTTLLNIIGGLDRYTSGELTIDGISTKKFKDKDWDNYRNHKVGFVFQTYNLIPHQTVLENVELALTLSGVSKKERRTRAIEVLTKVGLQDKLKNKPNQLSGGQMQRVAIARALVNDPEIILADEPTGALDSKTSVQIMEILKEVSKDRLVVMVTHNPDLAEQYSSRIIKLLDGELVHDSKPYLKMNAISEIERHKAKQEKQKENKSFKKTEKKKSMSFFMALLLSFKNLLTKKARTLLVAFAGSIGIIGIALILSISSGFSTYINKMQEDTLSSTPISIEAKSIDFSSVILNMFQDTSVSGSVDHEKDAVYPKDSITGVLDSIGSSIDTNDLTKFYVYLQENFEEIENEVSAVKYTYNINLEFYTETKQNVQPNSMAVMDMINKYSIYFFEHQSKIKVTPQPGMTYLLETIDGVDPSYTFMSKYSELDYIKNALQTEGKITISYMEVSNITAALIGMNSQESAGMLSTFGNMNIFHEMIDNEELIKSQYDLIGENSRYPENPNEVLLVLDKNHEVDEYALYALGLLSEQDITDILKAKIKDQELNIKVDYNSILGKEYQVLDNTDYYSKLEDDSVVKDKNYFQALENCSNKLKIVGIVRVNDQTENGALKTGIAYSSDFTKQMINHYNNSVAVTGGALENLELETPKSIQLYFNSFESKEAVQRFINEYNSQANAGDQITYNDLAGAIMGTVSVIINSITYVLIAFVSVSLVVSSIMIGIITYISVIERTKEIGVLRSVGASKRDVKRVFTAESFIIGLSSGVFGILISLLLTIPINVILKNFTGIAGLATLPWVGALILIGISVVLTFIAGLFPAHIASKKDPVLALRTE